MKESVGNVSLYNIIFTFLIITFSFLAAAISYSKAFRVNSKIIGALEQYEGYNSKAVADIDKILNGLGYQQVTASDNFSCPDKKGVKSYAYVGESARKYAYCIYEFNDPNSYYHWGVTTYIYIDIPIINNLLELPIYSISDSYYRFPKEFPKNDNIINDAIEN